MGFWKNLFGGVGNHDSSKDRGNPSLSLGGESNYSLKEVQHRAKQEDAEAQLHLGVLFHEGKRVSQDSCKRGTGG